MITMFLNAYWAFCTFGKTQADSLNAAFLWSKALSFWPFLVPLMLHFTLAFTESDLLKKKLIYVALYLPALLFSVLDLATNWISGTVVLMPWGYITLLPVNSMAANVGGVWSAILGLLIVFFYIQYYKRVGDKTKKQQTKFVAFGFMVPILLSLVTDSIFPAMNVDFPGLGSISGSITSVFVVYAMLKYNLFSFRPEIAAENIFSTMPDSVILVNLEGKIMKVNRSLMELTGYSEQEMVGEAISKMLEKANVLNQENTTPQILANLRKLREIKNYEISFYTKAGEKRTGTLSCSMVCGNGGQDVGAAFVLHDLTERKEMEQKLLRAERFASIGELAGLVGHDLRNPLSGIRGAAFYLKKKHADHLDAKDLEMFESMDKSINYSNKIINDLLDYSAEIDLHFVSSTPNGLLKNALTMVQLPENVKVVNETSDLPAFQVDDAQICRGFAAIIKNAYDAMPSGGELYIQSTVAGKAIVFTFKDTGLGMTQENLAKLWTPLFTTKAKGMGFGLPICKRIVEAHSGKISAQSILERGTVVEVVLPLHYDGANQK